MGYTLRLVVTPHCNFKCFFCYREGTACRESSLLSCEDFVSLVKNFAAIRPLTKVRVTGGEPLLYRDLVPLLKALKCEFPFLDVGFTTNASTPDRLLYIARVFSNGPLFLNISLPSLQADKFERITRSSRYSEVMSSIERLIAEGFTSNVSINFVFMPGMNDSELPAMVDFAQTNNLRLKVICLTVNEFNRAEIDSFGIKPSEESLIRDKIKGLGYIQVGSAQTFMKGKHCVKVVNCFAHQPIPYFEMFKTFRIYYDGRIGISGDYDGFIRPLDLSDPRKAITNILCDLEKYVKSDTSQEVTNG